MVSCVQLILHLVYFFGIEFTYVRGNEFRPNPDVDRHLALGRQYLSEGLYDDALSHYHAAVEADPFNYLTYFTRATLYLAVGRIASAVKDLSKVVELKPDFVAARLQRGNIFLKQGRLDEAHIDFEMVLRDDPSNKEALHGYGVIEYLKRDIQLSYALLVEQDYHTAVELLTKLLRELPWDPKLREMRATCYEKLGDGMSAIADLRSSLKSQSDNQLRYLRLSKLYYEVGDTEESLNAIRECLKFDPDHKGCFAHYKHVKKVAAQLNKMQEFINTENFADCEVQAEKALRLETQQPYVVYLLKSKLCKCLSRGGKYNDAVNVCSEALRMDPEDFDTYCERADAHLAEENFADAIHDYQKAIHINDHSQRAHDGLKRAQRREKQSKARDYYAILGVKRTANKREILKAYRKLAQKWHPDNFQGDEKTNAEKKFIEIAAAKEVLTDPEKRQKFDNGEDPLDPQSQQGGFNPFQHGFHPFEKSGPFTFKFHFS